VSSSWETDELYRWTHAHHLWHIASLHPMITRGSHIRVACGRVCNQDQIRSTDQCTFSDTKEAWLSFCPLNSCKIKQSSDQGWFSPIKNLDPGCKRLYWWCVCGYPSLYYYSIDVIAIIPHSICTYTLCSLSVKKTVCSIVIEEMQATAYLSSKYVNLRC